MVFLSSTRNSILFLSLLWLMPHLCYGANIKRGDGIGNVVVSGFRLIKLGLDEYATTTSAVVDHDNNFMRTNKIDQPGCYLINPFGKSGVVGADEWSFLQNTLIEFLAADYYDSTILNYANNIYLPGQNRHEFYFDIYSNNVLFLFSGWYGRFVHIIVFTDFDSKEGFAGQAQRFFKLPEIAISKIDYAEDVSSGGIKDFFYKYINSHDFKLVGYPFLKSVSEEEYSYEYTILDLTIYPREHKDEK